MSWFKVHVAFPHLADHLGFAAHFGVDGCALFSECGADTGKSLWFWLW
jgi:hypothetical protein